MCFLFLKVVKYIKKYFEKKYDGVKIKREGQMKNFFKDFKAFVSRGNIVDMAVGVIIGAAFGTIVTALVNGVFMPLVNLVVFACTGGQGINLITVLNGQPYLLPDESGVNPQCIFIDWGAFIQAMINFLIVALVLFSVLRIIMKSKGFLLAAGEKAKKGRLTKEEKAECKAIGVNLKDKEAVKKYLTDKAEKEEVAKAEAEAKAKAEEEEAKRNSTEYLLKEIRDLLKENKELKAKAKKSE